MDADIAFLIYGGFISVVMAANIRRGVAMLSLGSRQRAIKECTQKLPHPRTPKRTHRPKHTFFFTATHTRQVTEEEERFT